MTSSSKLYIPLVQHKPRVTAADIARLTGVGRAAVSNWRKRYDSFPVPVGGTAASSQFDLEEIERWLVEHGKLPALADEDRLWRKLLAAAGDPAAALVAAGEHLGGDRPLPLEVLREELTELSAKHGVRNTFELLWRRFADLPGKRTVTTPDALSDLMTRLAQVRGGTVLDPACGTGRLLRAAFNAGAATVYGQDNDPVAARLAQLWLKINEFPGEVRLGDSLRHNAYGGLEADAVVANPPFGLTNWGHEELGYDRRWLFGVPPRTEPELAWVQHALAHLKLGGRAVVLMPPAAASRRAGRRIRAELLRRGAIVAIVALPPGAAAPHAIGLYLWVLQCTTKPTATVRLVDASTEPLDKAYQRIVAAVDGDGDLGSTTSVIDLLDEEVNLTPSRHVAAAGSGLDTVTALRQSRDRLEGLLASLPPLLPAVDATEAPHPPLVVTISDLVRLGQLKLLGPVRVGGPPETNKAVLTSGDVIAGRPGTGRADEISTPRIVVRTGDVVVPTAAPALSARVIIEGGELLGRGLMLLRGDPDSLDPWFLAGHLRTAANERQAVSLSGVQRFDVRRAQVPRVPLDEQRRQGMAFRQMQLLEDAIRSATRLTEQLARQLAAGLVAGSMTVRNGRSQRETSD